MGGVRWQADVTPLTPSVGQPVRFTLTVPAAQPVPTVADCWEVDRTRPPGASERRVLHAFPGGVVACQILPVRSLPLRLGVPVAGGTAWFTIPVGPAPEPPAPPLPPATGTIPMDVQHDAMARLGDAWAALAAALDRDAPDLDAARAALPATRAWSALTPHFVLHRHEDAIEEFRSLAAAYLGELDQLAGDVRGGDGTAARARFRAIDRESCFRCHVKFRWGTVADLSRFPDLSDPERQR